MVGGWCVDRQGGSHLVDRGSTIKTVQEAVISNPDPSQSDGITVGTEHHHLHGDGSAPPDDTHLELLPHRRSVWPQRSGSVWAQPCAH